MFFPCPYGEAIRSRVCGCRLVERLQAGERESLSCADEAAHGVCVELLNHMRKKANFALGLTRTSGALPHGKAIRVQCGGLLGLQTALDKEENIRVDNIHGLIQRALRRFSHLDALPYPEIMRMVSRYRHRKPRARTL